jgi:predicted O-methyltransferase YrrM
MNGTLPQKAARLLGDLLVKPQHVPRYVRHNLVNGTSPLDLELPWFSYDAIDFLKQFLRPDMRVAEYGSGGSTLFFAQRVREVTSIEDNRLWFELVSNRAAERGWDHVQLKYQPYDFRNAADFESSDYLHALPAGPLDVVVIDGSEESARPGARCFIGKVRPACFYHAESRIAPGGIIIVDDSWRYPDLRASHQAQEMRTFQSSGPCRPGVTSTDIFFY